MRRVKLFLLTVLIGISPSACTPRTEIPRPEGVDLYVAGVQAHRAGDKAKAKETLKKATVQNPELTMSRVLLGDIYREDREYQFALSEYEVATRLDPYGFKNHYNVGVSFQLLNRLQEAAVAYLNALKLNPLDAKTNMNLGVVYLSLAQLDEAMKYLERAVALDPESAAAHANLGAALDTRGERALAERAYRRSLDLDPKQDATIINLGTNLLAQRKPDEAITTLKQVAGNSTSAPVRKRLADAYAVAGRLDEAIYEYKQTLILDPEYGPAMNDMGRALIARYRHGLELDEELRTLAVGYWRVSLYLNPNQPKIKALAEQWAKTRP